MSLPRRQYQVGPSSFSAVLHGGEWWVREGWYAVNSRGDPEDDFEAIRGPFPTQAAADAVAKELRE